MADDSSAETHCLWSFLHDNLNESFVSRWSVELMTCGQGHEERWVGLFVLVLYAICRVLFSSEGRFMFQG
jgi:hypothetical protein